MMCVIAGKLLPGVNVIIADPETRGQCGDSNLGEIWVECPHNANGYYTVFSETDNSYADHFAVRSVPCMIDDKGGIENDCGCRIPCDELTFQMHSL